MGPITMLVENMYSWENVWELLRIYGNMYFTFCIPREISCEIKYPVTTKQHPNTQTHKNPPQEPTRPIANITFDHITITKNKLEIPCCSWSSKKSGCLTPILALRCNWIELRSASVLFPKWHNPDSLLLPLTKNTKVNSNKSKITWLFQNSKESHAKNK